MPRTKGSKNVVVKKRQKTEKTLLKEKAACQQKLAELEAQLARLEEEKKHRTEKAVYLKKAQAMSAEELARLFGES